MGSGWWLVLALGLTAAGAMEVSWDTATLKLDDTGRVTSLVDRASGRELAVPGTPLCRLATSAGQFAPSGVRRDGERVTFSFPGGVELAYRVRTGAGWSWWAVEGVTGVAADQVESIRLANFNLDGLSTVGAALNAAYDDQFAVAVFGTSLNVHGEARRPSQQGGNHQGVTSTFEQVTDDVKTGHAAARFTARSARPTADGWAVRYRPFSPPLKLSGLKAIKLHIRGDGRGEHLKVQLTDGHGGYRDDYIPIDFTGWREVTCAQPGLNTVDLNRVVQLSFYYNSLPANAAVECRLDDVRAELADGRVLSLEDFEDPTSDLWEVRGVMLRADVTRRFGLTPAGFGLVAVPRSGLATAVESFEQAAGLPHPHPGGQIAKGSTWTKRSYLFITNFSAGDTEQVATWAKRGGFPMILVGDGSWNLSDGHHAVNEKHFPGGLPTLRQTADRFHQAGLKIGLHYLAPAVYGHDPYVTPKPDKRLVTGAQVPLAAPIDAQARFLPTTVAPTAFPNEDGGYEGQGTALRLGDEIIRYGAVKTTPPYGFENCLRGLHGTPAVAHTAGEPVQHLVRSYGYYLFDIDSSLADEVAAHVATVADAIGADMLYWDGSERLQGEHWYYNAKLQDTYYRHLKNRERMLFQGSSFSHWSWHIVGRYASADGHGDVKGYLDERLPFKWYTDNLMPVDCGWYYVYDPEVTVDQYDYILQKCIAFNASISVQTNPQRLADHPEIGAIFDLCNVYERLRLSGLIPADVKQKLAEPKREYRLLRDPLRLRRTTFGEWQTAQGAAATRLELPAKPVLPRARLGLQVRCGGLVGPGAAYLGPQAVTLEDFQTLAPYVDAKQNVAAELVVGTDKAGSCSAGVTMTFGVEPQGFQGGPCAVFKATSTRPDASGWAAIGKTFAKPLDLTVHQGIGFWLQGDGRGGKFKLQLRDATEATDYYLENDYVGWRYHQLVRPATPTPGPINYRRVQYLMFYYNAMPAKSKLTCRIAGVKALSTLDSGRLVNPTLTVGDRTVTFATALTEGERLCWFADEAPYVIPAHPDPRRVLATAPTIALPAATTAVLTFQSPPAGLVKVRLVQDNDEELPLPEQALATKLPGL